MLIRKGEHNLTVQRCRLFRGTEVVGRLAEREDQAMGADREEMGTYSNQRNDLGWRVDRCCGPSRVCS